MDDVLTIGAFARRCGISRSALRFYDECGLLHPVVVDDANGYRYYEMSQLPQAELIRRLRATDMPVGEVRAFVQAGLQQRRALFAAHVAAMAERAAALQAATAELRDFLSREETAVTASCTLSGRQLATAIDQVLFAVARDGDRPELTGVLIEVKDDSLRLVTTDSYRLAIRDVMPDGELVGGRLRALVRADALAELAAELGGPSRCTLRPTPEGGIEADVDGRTVSVPVVDEDFPDYEQVLLGAPAAHHGLVERRAFEAAFDGLSAPAVVLSLASDGVQVADGDDTTFVPTRWDGPDLRITVNPVFITEALHAHIGPDLAIEAVDALRPITFRSADEGTLTVLVMPIRVDE